MIHPVPNPHSARTRGFSLIEVLIGVVVLTFGLLGIAAVFPTVLRQQQASIDSVQAVTAARSAEEVIRGWPALKVRPSESAVEAIISGAAERISPANIAWRGWQLLLVQPTFSPNGEWTTPAAVPDAASASSDGLSIVSGVTNENLGKLLIGGDPATGGVLIPLSQRLHPQPFSGPANNTVGGASRTGGTDQPRYVWDIAVRRLDVGRPVSAPAVANDPTRARRDDAVQVAVFVRRIDGSLRLEKPAPNFLVSTLSVALAGDANVPNNFRRVPVASDVNGRPTFDGVGVPGTPRYSLFWTPAAKVVSDPDAITPTISRRWIQLTSTGVAGVDDSLVSVGQTFVDPDGRTLRVVERRKPPTGATGLAYLRVEPPIEPGDKTGTLADLTGGVAFDLLGTAQSPAAVNVFTIRP